MTELNDKTLIKSLMENDPLPAYIVAGNDAFLIDKCADAIIKASVDSEEGIVRLDAEKATDEDLESLYLNVSLISERKVAVFGGLKVSALPQGRYELLKSLVASSPEDVVTVFKVYSDEESRRFSVPKRTRELIEGTKNSAVVLALQKSGSDMLKSVEELADAQGCTIKREAALRVAELCANDLALIDGEIKKIAALSGYGEITLKHVDELCIRTPEAGVYDMISAMERGESKRALAVLEDMIELRTEPLAVCAALNTAFINLYRAKLVRNEKRSENAMSELFMYKKGDRKVSIAFERSAKYDIKTLERIIDILYELDKRLKSSPVDGNTILETGIIKLILAVKNR